MVSDKNIHVIKLSFKSLKEIVQKQFPFKVALSNPYKLCDFKPAYGHIFKDWVGKYDFWCYCDVDMLLGDLRSFFTENALNEYERCSCMGHISLYKNIDKINLLYKFHEGYPALNYKEVFQNEDALCFDEFRVIYTKYVY